MNDEILRWIVTLTARTPKSLETRMLKLTNEVGELAQAVDIFSCNIGTAYRKSENPLMDVLEEAVDVYIVIESIIMQLRQQYNISEEQVTEMTIAKLKKWREVISEPEFKEVEDEQTQ